MRISRHLGKAWPSWSNPLEKWFEENRKYLEELDKEEREREAERQRLMSLPPRYIIHMVHGTFAKNARWIEPDSRLGLEVTRLLGWRARIEPFRWSGKNSVSARWQAAQELRQRLAESRETFPAAHQIVIAHSHGGNVALWALTDKRLAGEVLGVVTLSTPFLTARWRPHTNLIDAGAGLFAGLFVTWAVLFFGVYRGHGLSGWPWALGAGTGMFAAMISGEWLIRRMEQYAERICAQMPKTALLPEQVAIIRVQGDEATAAITGVRLAGILTDLLWTVLSAPLYERLENLLTVFDYASVRSKARRRVAEIDAKYAGVFKDRAHGRPVQLELPMTSHPSPPVMPERDQPDSPFADRGYGGLTHRGDESASWRRIVTQSVVESLPMLLLYLIREGSPIARAVALACGLIYAAPAALSFGAVLLGLPFAVLSSITMLPCGWTMPLAGPYLQLLAECCPPGAWNVTQFEGAGKPTGLFHSEAYQNYETPTHIAQWIRDRTKLFAAEG